MSEIYFVRHGQASLGAKDYDKLSPLGWEQARWLGEFFRERDLSFDRVVVGDMRRHKETLQSIGAGMGQQLTPEIDARFNEFTFRPVMRLYRKRHRPGAAEPTSAREFFGMLREVMEAWISGDLDQMLSKYDDQHNTHTETWAQFSDRVAAGLGDAHVDQSRSKVLIVSSGGPKSLAMKHVLGLSNDAVIDLMMQIRNTATTRFLTTGNDRIALRAFNVLSHMERPDRRGAITMI